MNSSPDSSDRAVGVWLLVVAALVFAMVVLGGVTRLTRSGLSIVEWQPVLGAIPPVTESQWIEEFNKYRQTPEYRTVNAGMSLPAFQRIYYVEWAHRLLGRLIALAVLLPLAYFAVSRRISRALALKLLGIFVLGGLQGALGWIMVRSGLVDIPRVSPYRLTAHLALAVAIYGSLLWLALGLVWPHPKAAPSAQLRRAGIVVTWFVFVMILAGGFVAGTHAGFAFNTFPLMNGHFLPDGLYQTAPWWADVFEDIATVQFHHRVLAYALVVVAVLYWWRGRASANSPWLRRGFDLFLVAVIAQATLGVATLLLVVPVTLAAAHQAGALAVFTVALCLNYALQGTARASAVRAPHASVSAPSPQR